MTWNALSAWDPLVSPGSSIGLASFSSSAPFGGFVLSAISGISSPCKMPPPVTLSLSLVAIFEGNFFATFRLNIHRHPSSFSWSKALWTRCLSFSLWLGFSPKVFEFIAPCFPLFDIEHLTFTVRVFLTIHSFTRNFATIFWENHSFFGYSWSQKSLWLGSPL